MPEAAAKVELQNNNMPGAVATANGAVISGDALKTIDANNLILRFKYTLPTDAFGADGEIKDTGAKLYARAWAEDNAGQELTMTSALDKKKSVAFESLLLKNSGNPYLIDIEQDNTDEVTKANVTIKNMSMQPMSNGILTLMLRDSDGNLLETVTTAGNLISLGKEGLTIREKEFTRLGDNITASFAILSASGADASLSSVTVDGGLVTYDEPSKTYSVSLSNLYETNITAVANNPSASVELVGYGEAQESAAGAKVELSDGKKELTIKVTPPNGESVAYNLTINSSIDKNAITQAGAVAIGIEGERRDWYNKPVKFELTSNVENAESYAVSVDGGKNYSEKKAMTNKFELETEGAQAVKAAVYDAEGYRVESAVQNVSIDLTAPSMSGVQFAKTSDGDFAVTVASASDTLSGLDKITANIGGKTLKLSENNGIFAVSFAREQSVSQITVTAYDIAGNAASVTLDADMRMSAGGSGLPTYNTPTYTMPTPSEWQNPFIDAHTGDWFYSDVAYAHQNGIFNGITANTFEPNTPMNRAMLVTVLWRLHGSPAANGKSQFTDVADGLWYSDAVTWAAENGVVMGIGDGLFDPNTEITREQMAAVLYRYMNYTGVNIPVTAEYRTFADEDAISDYAKSSVQTLNKMGIINGKGDSVIDPRGTATRAEVAAMLHRFMELVK